MGLNRRDFLALSGAVLGTAALGEEIPGAKVPAEAGPDL